ncbi:MAG: methyltransferase domain-containing protein [Candidatus Kerfeldbacteria bacterium]
MHTGEESAILASESDVLDPRKLLTHTGLGPGMTCADFGVGREGSFILTAADMVTATGRVYALDVVKEILEVINGLAQDAGHENVLTIWTDLELYGAAKDIADGFIDVGLLVNTLFQSEQKEDMFRECIRMMRPGGKLLVVDWKPVNTAFGPPKDKRVDPQEIKTLATGLGLQLIEEFEAGEYHWGQLYQR